MIQWVTSKEVSGSYPHQDIGYCHGKCKPIVVIDPEDREAVERLAKLLMKEGRCKQSGLHACGEPECIAGRMQAALREFANPKPPKPDEPMGLGALVKDRDGRVWLRGWPSITGHPWRSPAPDDPNRNHCRNYVGIDVVEIVSEGTLDV